MPEMSDAMPIEPYGDERLIKAQLELYARRVELRTLHETFEQGRTFGLLNVNPSDLRRRVLNARSPARVLVHVALHNASAASSFLLELGYAVFAPLKLMIGARALVHSTCLEIIRAGAPMEEISLVRIDGESPRELIVGIQSLQVESGVTPVPGWLLRGEELAVVTMALVDFGSRPLGVGSVQAIGNPRGLGATAMGFGICVSASHQRRGLGTFLNSHLLTAGLVEFAAASVCEIVEDFSSGSRRMNDRCGLCEDDRTCFLFGERAG